MKKLFSTLFIFLFGACVQIEEKVIVDPPAGNTQMTIVNDSKDSLLVYLTLSGYSGADTTLYLQNVNGVFGCTQSGLVGSFYLGSKDSVSYTSSLWLSGNVSFGSQPLNCFTDQWSTGVNPFEFNLNCGQESIDISAVGGVNCLLTVDLYLGPNWAATPSYPNVRSFYNDSMYLNTNLVGVFPYGCTNCTNDLGKQSCVLRPETPSSQPVCNPTRAAGVHGGKVVVHFEGYTNYQICE